MPLAVTIETAFGPVGIVHAESPHRSWPEAVLMLQSGLDTAVDDALFGPAVPVETARRHRLKPVQGRVTIAQASAVDLDETTYTEWNAGRRDGECGRRTLSSTSWPDSPRGGLPTIRSSDEVSTR